MLSTLRMPWLGEASSAVSLCGPGQKSELESRSSASRKAAHSSAVKAPRWMTQPFSANVASCWSLRPAPAMGSVSDAVHRSSVVDIVGVGAWAGAITPSSSWIIYCMTSDARTAHNTAVPRVC